VVREDGARRLAGDEDPGLVGVLGGWVGGGGGMVMLSRAEPEEDGGRVVDDSMVAARWLQAAWKIGHA
jgi:hypothetical protein